MKMRRRTLFGLALSLAWVREGLAASDAPSAAALAKPVAHPRQLDELLMTSAAGNVPLASLRGKLIVLNLWAPWCLPCRREMPSLSRMAGAMQHEAIAVLPLSFDWRGLAGVTQFYGEMGIVNLPALTGDAGNLQRVAEMTGLPSTLVIDSSGTHRWTVTGEAVWDDATTLTWLRSQLPGA